MGDLVVRLRDHGTDLALAEVFADRAGRVPLVGQHGRGPGPGPALRPAHPDGGHDLREGGGVTGLAGSENEREWPAPAVGGEVDLRGQSAAGPAEGMVERPARRGPY
ncbi:hypothetical protein Sxan_34080 [Streptomyces xanthophaeus]|uniref:Uncharacterized protein n=1 Tax=Streptomyces xanthophaeus TaxID=67385 RepID=A0A919LJ15_9ACTN|nr:hypothetical protein Sxan_34080 [Streptomyces xanthophaeus]